MSFQTALSGLNAAAGNLNVTGHNIANSSTTGFKKSRAEFADVYAVSFGGVASTATGSGVRLANVAQQFTQGNIDFTDNNLDLAISGEGFFVLSEGGAMLYSRAGNFSVDRDGYVINAHGQRLQSYAVNSATGLVSNFTPEDLHLNLGANPASATDNILLNLNLDASSEATTVAPIDMADPDTYNFSTTTTVYDSLGVTHDATMYFQKATATSGIEMSGALDTAAAAGTTYSYSGNPVTIYDSLGNAYSIDIDFQKVAGDTWDVQITGDVTDNLNIDFSAANKTFTIAGIDYDGAGGALPADLTFDFTDVVPGTVSTVIVDDQTNDGPPGYWNVMMAIDGQQFDTETIQFSDNGTLATSPASISFTNATVDSSTTSGIAGAVSGFSPSNAATMQIDVDFSGSTQFGSASTVNTLVQNGYTTGRLSGLSIDAGGVVFARYTNGQSESLGAVAIARFSNPQGLQQVGDTNWAASFESGDPIAGQADTGTFGQIQSGALESSNVDISKQLVNMIIAQRDFQANAKMITTEDQVTQTIINIR